MKHTILLLALLGPMAAHAAPYTGTAHTMSGNFCINVDRIDDSVLIDNLQSMIHMVPNYKGTASHRELVLKLKLECLVDKYKWISQAAIVVVHRENTQ